MKTCITGSLILLLCLVYGCMMTTSPELSPPDPHASWRQYGGGADQSKYVDMAQITPANVSKLQIAWVYPTNDNQQYLFNPLIVDTVMYVLAKDNSLVALNAITGKEIWIHANLRGITWRGINYWENEGRTDRRLLFTIRNTLQAIDAQSGKSILSFGNNGAVSLKEGLGRDPSTIARVQSNTPGVIFDSLIILGSSPGENYFSAPGHIRAYNVVTGKQAWIFHTIPQPGEYGYATWPKNAYKYAGGANVWGELSLDEKRGIVYCPVGSPTYDYYGADRTGSNLFGNCLLALDVRTGKRRWHFQTVHHDLWDYDLTAAPQLITVQRNGASVDAVALATKHGFMFAFDRVTGKPLWPIVERPVPASTMPGEKAWPTQPFPTVLQPFTRQVVKADDLNPYYSEAKKAQWKRRFAAARTGFFQPPSDKYETIIIPGAVGGANLGNTAANPGKGIVYVSTQDYPSVFKLEKVEERKDTLTANEKQKAAITYKQYCQSCHGAERKGAAGPALLDMGERVNFEQFKTTVLWGKGQMPGFQHIDDRSLAGLYAWLAGKPANPNRRPPAFLHEQKMPEGPVVASGGAPLPEGETQRTPGARNAGMRDYPAGIPVPVNRYTSDYGLQHSDLMSPVWSSILAYDMNKGTVLWRKPLGQDARIEKQGGKHTGIPIGSQRKGMIVTATGIVFATAKGGKLYAFDSNNGELLWTAELSHETQGLPAMYAAKGKQYMVVSATSPFTEESIDKSKEPGALPRGYVAYALP